MTDPNLDIAPPTRLAITYAPAHIQPAFTLMLQFDMRFADILRKAREPMIAQIKMAWWRDAFAKAPHLRPTGEPLLQALNETEGYIPLSALEALASAWETLLVCDEWTDGLTAKHAQLRSEAIYQTYAHWVGSAQDMRPIGQLWAIETLRQFFPSRVPDYIVAPQFDLPKARLLRPLSILTMSVRAASGPRLVWHALTGL
jgi:phytoene synthase